jgi:hypothetical protein
MGILFFQVKFINEYLIKNATTIRFVTFLFARLENKNSNIIILEIISMLMTRI